MKKPGTATEGLVQQRVGDVALPQAQHKATSPTRKPLPVI